LAFHGPVCSGQIIGVRMARLGLLELGIADPRHYCHLLAYFETGRCLTDAVLVVTGYTLGRGPLRLMDYGKLAATLVDVATCRTVRMTLRSTWSFPTEGADLLQYWVGISDAEMLTCEPVAVEVPSGGRRGRPGTTKLCSMCWEAFQDGRETDPSAKTI
jgi:formylmethanofuran dehydrogenase subunit E